jgi:hypothetical protein
VQHQSLFERFDRRRVELALVDVVFQVGSLWAFRKRILLIARG